MSEYRGYSIGEAETARGTGRSWSIFPIRAEGNTASNRVGSYYSSEEECRAKIDRLIDQKQVRNP